MIESNLKAKAVSSADQAFDRADNAADALEARTWLEAAEIAVRIAETLGVQRRP